MFVGGNNDAVYVEVLSGHTTEICLGLWEVYSEIGQENSPCLYIDLLNYWRYRLTQQ